MIGSTSPPVQVPTGTVLFSLEYGVEGADGSKIMTVSPDGTGLQAVTRLKLGFATNPSWSADHHSILFDLEDVRTQVSHIYSIPAAGGHATPLTTGEVVDRDPNASPDGRYIVFARADPVNTPTSIYVMNSDGSHRIRLTHGTGSDGDSAPTYSPDGRHIAFLRNGAIEIANLDGSGIRELVGPQARASLPRWSPDGMSVVYGNHSKNNEGTVVVAVDGGHPQTVGGVGDASFSPDGGLIVGNFWEDGQPFVGLATMQPDGSDVRIFWHPHPNRDIFPNFPTWVASA